MSDLSRRLGCFTIDGRLIERDPRLARDILAGCVVVDAELKWGFDRVRYVAMHEDFDLLERGFEPPEYDYVLEGTKRVWRRRDGPRGETAGRA